MDYAKAYCKNLPHDKKILFTSMVVEDLKKALNYCNLCSEKQSCLSEGLRNKGNSGVWGGKILSMGEPIRENSKIKRISYWRR